MLLTWSLGKDDLRWVSPGTPAWSSGYVYFFHSVDGSYIEKW